MKRAVVAVVMVLSLMIMAPGKVVAAATDEQYGWSEGVRRAQSVYRRMPSTSRTVMLTSDSKWDWQLIDSAEIQTSMMLHVLNTYEMFSQTQDCRWGKVEGFRSSERGDLNTYGYVRIRFESLTGRVYTNTDSGRVWGYRSSVATTPNPSYGGVLHAYCGD